MRWSAFIRFYETHPIVVRSVPPLPLPSSFSLQGGEQRLPMRDVYGFYEYVYDVLMSRRGGLLRSRLPSQSLEEMAADWLEANPHMHFLKDVVWTDDVLRHLGFDTDNGRVTISRAS